ncbi:MAG: crossover junction endodeoxyribonuclease RuvC [Dethiobacter sp.]|jgi:crossover junction endodeoxyribonuclease RuvC|nr:MAG: crossover junction endodeoxyribonuclease RuvC [Dethiobacter sp.]
MRVLGIDPGLAAVGYGLVEKNGGIFGGIDYGYISTPANMDLSQRLHTIFQNVKMLISRFSPDVLAMEKLFFCKNIRTAMQVGEARGAIFTAAAEKELPVFEYTPLQVKQAVAGYGRAGKKQVQQMVCLLLKLPGPPRPDDAADALAVALCHLQSSRWQQLVEKERSTDIHDLTGRNST